jgi:hypothetical protein
MSSSSGCVQDRSKGLARKLFSALFLISMISLLLPLGSQAQGLSGIKGTITDQSGAVVPDTTITVTNVATNVVHSAVTTSQGTYFITDLNPGTYTVKIEKAGFQTGVLTGVNVYVSQVATADSTLLAGAAATTIEVIAPAITLQTDEPNLGTVIQKEIVDEVPIAFIGGGRDRQIDSYLFLAPGVTGGSFSHRINGGIDFQNEVMFNGVVSAQAETQGFQTIYNPPFELVSEINVVTSNFSAQYGFAQGVASYRFASGTNQLHGDVFEINRNSFFDAAGANPPGSGVVNGVFVKGPVPHDVENSFGFSVGGPVWIPKLYNGKNKTFFHVSLDWYRINAAATGNLNVPSQAMVGGDFSALCATGFTNGLCNDRDGSGNVQNQIYVPPNFSGASVPSGCSAPAPGQPWAGDVIPTSCFSALSQTLLPLIPTPQFTTGNVTYIAPQVKVLPTRQTNGGFTIDQNIGQNTAFHVAWWRNVWNNLGCSVNCVFFNNEFSGAQINPNLGTGFYLTSSHTFSTHLTMTVGFSWLGEINNQYNTQTGVNFPGVTQSNTLPFIRFNGNAGQPWTPNSWGMQASSGPLYGETFSVNRKLGLGFDNNWLYIHGRHTYNFGLEIRRAYQDDHECQGCGGGFAFDAATTADPTNIHGSTGAAFASFLLGDVDSAFRRFVAENRLRNLYFAPYIQDDIKISPKLTINAGLRWDIPRPFLENDDNVTFFSANTPNPGAVDPATGQPLLGAASKIGNCAGCAGFRRADIHWKNFSPRFGFTYQLNKQTVVLGGFGVNFLDEGPYEFGNNKLSVDYGSLSAGQIVVNSFGSNAPHYGIWDGNPLGVPSLAQFSSTAFNGTGPLFQFSKDPGPNAYIQMWNVGVQRELSGNMLLSVSYIGNRAVHLTSMLNPINQTNPAYLAQFCPSGDPNDPTCLMSPSNSAGNNVWTSAAAQAALQSLGFGQTTYATGTCGNSGGPVTLYTPYVNFCGDYGSGANLSQALLPHPMFNPSESSGGLTNQFNMAGSSFYNALQVQLQKRFSDGLSFLMNYTLSKNMSNTDSGFSTFNFGALNGFDQKSEWSIAGNDQKHVLNIAGFYELPIGPGKKFLNKGGLVAKNALGGWRMSVVTQYSTGTPISINSFNNDVFLNGFNRANYDPTVALHVNYNNYYKGLPIFTQSAFSDPGFKQGNEPRNLTVLRNPNNANETMALSKRFFFGEKANLELRMEYQNIFNRMQVCGPSTNLDTNVDDGVNNFGFVSPNGNGAPGGSNVCQANTRRQGEIFLRLTF